jgi:glycogen synthase
MKILVVGPVPPPYGGVAVFVERLVAALRGRGLETRLLNPLAWDAEGGLGRVKKALAFVPMFFNDADVVHDNVGPYFWQSAAGRWLYGTALALSGKPVVLNVHQGKFPEIFAALAPPAQQAIRRILRRLRLVVSDNEHIREFLLREGVPADRVTVLPSFVPFGDACDSPLPSEVETFLATHSPVIAVPGYTYSPVYNFDAVLRLTARLRERFPRLGVQLVISRFVLDPAHKEYVLGLRRDLGLEECVTVVSDIPEVLPLFRRADALLRSTSSDGSSLSVLEALYVGTPVVATDCAERPPGTILFPVGDWDAAGERLAEVLGTPAERRPNPWVRDQAERVLDGLIAGYAQAVRP